MLGLGSALGARLGLRFRLGLGSARALLGLVSARARLDSARTGSARFVEARLSSARLGSAVRFVEARLRNARQVSAGLGPIQAESTKMRAQSAVRKQIS